MTQPTEPARSMDPERPLTSSVSEPESVVQENETDAAKILQLAAKVAELEDRNLRLFADFENFRRRAHRDLAMAEANAMAEVIAAILPVVDNLERAAKAAEGGPPTLTEGLSMLVRQAAGTFERLGVQSLPGEGATFDPTVHEAVGTVETTQWEPGTVAEVLARGYRLADRVIRPSLVRVAERAPEPPEAGEDPAGIAQ